jgi:nanoRNase/pAp phosphatase (c-di-AMP/oligoRNAs hydrolase)
MKAKQKTRDRLKRIRGLLEEGSSMLIVMQDNPDPDSIAAAVAMRKLANKLSGVLCSIAHGGTVGRAENRALVKYLGLNLRRWSDIEIAKFDCTALVDTQPNTGNNSFPPDRIPDIVIDHHPLNDSTRKAPITDIRSRYGATSTILLEYLTEADIALEVPLATALLYGIRSDTQDLGKQAVRADIEAIWRLYPLANKRMLSEIQRGRVRREYYRFLADALKAARVYGNCIITSLGRLAIPDMVGEVADLLLRDDTIEWVLCWGVFRDQVLFSIRTSEAGGSAADAARSVVAGIGTGGGHESLAGGQIPLKRGSGAEIAEIEKRMRARFIRAARAGSRYGVPLLRKREKRGTDDEEAME